MSSSVPRVWPSSQATLVLSSITLQLNQIRPMKLIDTTYYVQGWCIDILKFRRRSLIEVTFEDAIYQSLPSVLVQVGPSEIFYLSIGLVKGILSLTIWGRHYDD